VPRLLRVVQPLCPDRLLSCICGLTGLLPAIFSTCQFRFEIPFIWLSLCLLSTSVRGDDRDGVQFFEAKIRPVLIKHCYECHAADSKSLKGGLLVDSAAGLRAGGDSGPAIIAGQSEDSLLLQALRYENYEMPPSGKLPDQVVQDFARWIEMGAPDPRRDSTPPASAQNSIDLQEGRKFWAFQPVESHRLPTVQQSTWVESWIDQFVLAKMEEQGLQPQPDTDRATLLRRLSYDLTGLPPTLTAQATYLQNPREDAISDYVETLLASPEFGVQWGRHWLDVARYADSNGGDFNATFHNAWRYRNYIIDCYNADRPFTDLILEQIAGDLLPAEDEEQRTRQLVATGFLMLGTKMLSERDKEKLRMDVVDDQVSTIGSAFLGLTLGCARCHDHKFDPIPTRDYYALAGIFRSTQVLDGEIQKYVSNWVRQPLPIDSEHARALKAYEAQLAGLKQQLKRAETELKSKSVNHAREAALQQGIVIDDVQAELVGAWKSSTFSPGFIGKGYIHDDKQDKGKKSATFRTKLPVEGEYEVRIAYAGLNGRATNVPVTVKHAEGESVVLVDQSRPAAILNLLQGIGTWRFTSQQPAEVIISNAETEGYVLIDAVQFVPVGNLLAVPTPDDQERQHVAEQAQQTVESLKKQIKLLNQQAPLPAPMAFAVNDAPDRGDCNLCIRGESGMLGEKVPRGFLSVASTGAPPTIAPDESGRLELAHWIANPHNPLTARVYVNRIWHHLLGAGLVRSVDNFGQLGDRPTHADLLDQLAVEFIEHGWSTKWLVREIVLSHVYRLSSKYEAASWQTDPENKLLWRAHRKRISAESIRDTILSATGQLESRQMESPVAGLGVLVTVNRTDDQGYQAAFVPVRTIYEPVIRSELSTLLRVFDFADPDFSAGERARTNVPAQALWMLNSQFISDRADQLVDRIFESEAATEEDRIELVSKLALGRPPTYDEARVAATFLEQAIPAGADESVQRAAWQDLVHALFGSTSFRMLD